MVKLVAYYRVSTQRQGRSGLGLEGQQTAVEAYAKQIHATIIASYVEIESGKRADRPQLAKAIAHSKATRATLTVAKLDRLARNVALASKLMESGVEFVCCDNPHANKLTLHILMAVAEDEARRISDRTKAALSAAKARGVKLGSTRPGHWDGREANRLQGARKGTEIAAVARSEKADEHAAFHIPEVMRMKAEGETLQVIASRLNEAGHTTSRGKPWTATAVLRLLRRQER